MKKYNFLSGAPTSPEGSASSPERLSRQAKRLAIIGGVGVLLLGAAYLYTSYFREVAPSPPPPRAARRALPPTSPPKPSTPSLVKPEGESPRLATKVPLPKRETRIPLEEATPPRPKHPPKPRRPAEIARQRSKPKPAETGARAEKPPTQARARKPSTPTLQASPAQGKGPFTVQVASLVINRNALALKKRLAQLGYTPVVHMTTSLISQHRVYVGEFISHDEAERTARRLNVDGFPSNMVKGGDGKFRLEVGSYYNLNKAIDLAHMLQEKNYTPKVASQAVPTSVHQVRVGEYESRAKALKALEALKKQGFAPIIVKR